MRACMACGAREQESKRARSWSNPLKRARRSSSTLGRYRLPPCSLTLRLSASRCVHTRSPSLACPQPYARLTLSPPRHGWLHGVLTVLTPATHTHATHTHTLHTTSLSEACVYSLVGVSRRRRCLDALLTRSYGGRSTGAAAMPARWTTTRSSSSSSASCPSLASPSPSPAYHLYSLSLSPHRQHHTSPLT